jgi:hypothetical protein
MRAATTNLLTASAHPSTPSLTLRPCPLCHSRSDCPASRRGQQLRSRCNVKRREIGSSSAGPLPALTCGCQTSHGKSRRHENAARKSGDGQAAKRTHFASKTEPKGSISSTWNGRKIRLSATGATIVAPHFPFPVPSALFLILNLEPFSLEARACSNLRAG